MKLYRKALVSFAVTFTGALAVAAVDNAIALGEWLAAAAAATATAGAVFGVRNTPPTDLVDDEDAL